MTALHEATHERNDLSERLARVLGGVAEFVVTCEIRDGRTHWVHTGPGAERVFGGPIPEGADGPSIWLECVHPDDRPLLDEYFAQLMRREPAEATYRLRGLDGVERWVWARARPHAGEGAVLAYDAVLSDVTERERARIGLTLAREEAERRSRVDPTTGLFNRHHLLDVARRELARSQRELTHPALVLLDVDRLRDLNERGGHAVGDAVLRELAGRLSHSVRTYDTISHVGGGRFAVLVPDLRDGEALRRICAEIAATLTGEPLRSAGRELHVTVTAAGARAHPGTTIDALLHSAEVALAAAKRNGAAEAVPETTRREPPIDDHGEAVRVAATLARAAAEREGVPHEHEVGVAELAELVGRELGLPESLQGDLRLAGLLHDVGTIAVAGAVLSKPGPLDEHEWVVLREHPSIGADMVARIPGLARTQLAIRHHHERFDGQGYPDRLAGEAIPMAARVLATVDAYTAMTEDAALPRGARPRRRARGATPQCRHAARPGRRRGALPRARRRERRRSRRLDAGLHGGDGARGASPSAGRRRPRRGGRAGRSRVGARRVTRSRTRRSRGASLRRDRRVLDAAALREVDLDDAGRTACGCPWRALPTVQQTTPSESLPPPVAGDGHAVGQRVADLHVVRRRPCRCS